MSQTLQEIRTLGDRWLKTIYSLQDALPTTPAPALDRQQAQLVKTLEYLLTQVASYGKESR
jgi:hypothetical protein